MPDVTGIYRTEPYAWMALAVWDTKYNDGGKPAYGLCVLPRDCMPRIFLFL